MSAVDLSIAAVQRLWAVTAADSLNMIGQAAAFVVRAKRPGATAGRRYLLPLMQASSSTLCRCFCSSAMSPCRRTLDRPVGNTIPVNSCL